MEAPKVELSSVPSALKRKAGDHATGAFARVHVCVEQASAAALLTCFGRASRCPAPAAAEEGHASKYPRVPPSPADAEAPSRGSSYVSLTTHPGRVGVRPVPIRVRAPRPARCTAVVAAAHSVRACALLLLPVPHCAVAA